MKSRRLITCLFFLLLIEIKAQSAFLQIQESEKKIYSHKTTARSCAQSNNYDVNYYRCFWNLDPSQNFISGSVTMYFRPQGSIDSLQMDASVNLVIDSVLYHQSSLLFSQQTGDILQVKFPQSLNTNIDSLIVFYHGYPQASGFGSFIQSTHSNAHIPVVWTLSEPYGAKDWWPCKQTLEDKADSIDVYISTPQGNNGASNGLLKEIIPAGANNIYHWKHKYPIATYLVCAATTNYIEFTDTAHLSTGDLPILNYTYPEDSIPARQTDSQLVQVMHYYDSLFIPYPFMREKYGQTQFGWSGGMEHQTMTFIGGYFIELSAHELAHQWFGDRVTCGSWRDIWLNEGFAVYCTAISVDHLEGNGYFKQWRDGTASQITSLPDGSVYVDDTTSVSRVFDGRLTYDKGAFLLHMLRWKLGDNAFFAGIRNYLNDVSLAYSFARTALLQQHLENVSGQSLDNFFNQWFYGQGYPSYLVLWKQDNANQMTITVQQTTSHPSVSFYEMPVPVYFKGGNRDTTIVFNHTYSGEVFTASLPFKADSIIFDPDGHILSAKNKIENEYEYLRGLQDIVVYPNPSSEIMYVEVNDLSNFPRQVEVYNVLGQKVLDFVPAENKFTIPVGGLASGTYYLKIISGDKVHSQKIIKQK